MPAITQGNLQQIYGLGGYNSTEFKNISLIELETKNIGINAQVSAACYVTYKATGGTAYFIVVNVTQAPNWISIGNGEVERNIGEYVYVMGSNVLNGKLSQFLQTVNLFSWTPNANQSTIVMYNSERSTLILVYLQGGLSTLGSQTVNTITQQ